MNGQTDIFILYRETVNFLDRLAGEVREGKNVMLASQFARWLQFSGLNKIFKENPSCRKNLEVNAGVVERKTEDLLFECGELFRGGKADPKYAASDIAEINRKLDLLMERVSESNGVELVSTVRCGYPVVSDARRSSLYAVDYGPSAD